MTSEIALVLGIIIASMALFATEKLRVDLVALLVLLTLAFTGLVGPEEMFAGFASPAVVTVWAVYIVSGGLFKTGVADILGKAIMRLAGESESRLIALIMLTCGTMSAFMNNIGATAVLMPAVIGISRRTKIPASRLLMPLAVSSLMGGNMTLIGTPPNVLASHILLERGLTTLGFFDYTPMGVIIFGVGILFMVLIGRHLLPAREQPKERQIDYQLRKYVSEVRVLPRSVLAGKTLVESRLGADYDLTVLSITRDDELITEPHRDVRIQCNDLLIVSGTVENLMRTKGELALEIQTEEVDWPATEKVHTVEATLAPRSLLTGRSLAEAQLRNQYGFTALAIWRHGEIITEALRDVRLKFGDTLLLQGPRHRLPALHAGNDFLLLEPVELEERRRDKTASAIAVMALVLFLASVGRFPTALAMVIGACLMVLSGCLTMDEAYQSIEWRSVFLIACMLPLGMAMETTGTARFLADRIIGATGGMGPMGVMAGILLLCLLTEFISNAVATVLIVPIAIDIALGLGASPQAFALATVIGVSSSFLTPMGHQANVLVFGAGGYRFSDYLKVGLCLTLVLFATILIILPLVWPLFP